MLKPEQGESKQQAKKRSKKEHKVSIKKSQAEENKNLGKKEVKEKV